MEMSKEYADALTAWRAANFEYTKAINDYRKRIFDDPEFIAARNQYEIAWEIMDAAERVEIARNEP